MKQTIWTLSVALVSVGIIIAQAPAGPAGPPAGQGKGAGKGKGAPRNPAQSPASRPVPETVTPQTYSADQIQAGESRFAGQCGFCHGRDAAGGETGPDLTRSKLVAEDTRGDKIGPLLIAGRADQGMPSFTLSQADLGAIVAFIHDQKTKSEALGGNRRVVDPTDLAVGSAEAGRTYFNGAGGCAKCHSPTGDLMGVATRFQGLALIQRLLYPTAGRPAPARPKVVVTLASGQIVAGPLATEDEFTVVVLDPAGMRQTFQKSAVTYKIDDPMSAHFDLLGKYTDDDMHNIFAYLDTLK